MTDLKNHNLATCVTFKLTSSTCLSLAAIQYTLFVRIHLNTRNRILLEKLTISKPNSLNFMKPEISSTCSQELATCLSREKYKPSPRLPHISWRSFLILSPHLSSSQWFLLSGFHTKPLYARPLSPYLPHAQRYYIILKCESTDKCL